MKKILYFLILVAFTSCSKKDDVVEPTTQTDNWWIGSYNVQPSIGNNNTLIAKNDSLFFGNGTMGQSINSVITETNEYYINSNNSLVLQESGIYGIGNDGPYIIDMYIKIENISRMNRDLIFINTHNYYESIDGIDYILISTSIDSYTLYPI